MTKCETCGRTDRGQDILVLMGMIAITLVWFLWPVLALIILRWVWR